ncbi:four-carbon acid sugar kinase family protein [Advenella mimigardefordensis]|uniref:YgbK-like domain-containing protein n=1 Tax=Advenella mimigardefordensis (strain DSM 17166 / LMG 22922 / DPN7) TaxID=1247726 RepID=W0PJP8_ADVMD|nr:four-carbon acid sugar kinase family protein [Advenella mimigardefordensis]AHG65775.1 YgbK-like domain-containing protein [Advenella mimigardefordensis DPN7]
MKPQIAIIADDLTGAGDSAVQFVRCGWETQLYVGGSEEAFALGDMQAQVVSVNSNSRALAPQAAADAVAREMQTFRKHDVRHVFKKVDSTLRGAFAAEIEAARQQWHADAIAVVCPAYPATGRTLEHGILLVNGIPVTDTSAGTDPVTPVTESSVPTILNCNLVSPTQDDTPATLAQKIGGAGAIVVVDARTDADLKLLAQAIVLLGERALPVGAGGLAMAMAAAWASDHIAGDIVLAVVTSQHSATRAQVAALQEQGATVQTPEPQVLADDALWQSWQQEMLEQVSGSDMASRILVLLAPARQVPGLTSATVARRLGQLALTIAGTGKVRGLIATGGDGAEQVMMALQATGIRLIDEVSGGVPLGTLIGGNYTGMPIVTKAGGFGSEHVLIQAAETLMERKFK